MYGVKDRMTIRKYRSEDCAALAALFYDTVHSVNRRDYTQEQADAWATGEVDLAAWDASLSAHLTLIAEENGRILGFADMDRTGYLDRLFIHKDAQGRGIATALCDALEQAVGGRFLTHASITARPFFEKRGYRVMQEREVERRGIMLKNFVMEKDL